MMGFGRAAVVTVIVMALMPAWATTTALAATGDLDTTFGSSGARIVPVSSEDDLASAVVVAPDGSIFIAGYSYASWVPDFEVVKLDSSGFPDPTFSDDGKVTVDFGSYDYAYALTLQVNGKVVVVGTSGGNFAVARLNTDGSLDQTFDLDGKVTTSLGSWSDDARAVAIQGNDKIVVAGTTQTSGSGYGAPVAGVVRYDTDGTLDTTFSGDGIATASIGATYTETRGMALQDDGRIVVAGSSDDDFAVIRFNTDGSLDTNFSADGKLSLPIDSSYDFGQAVAIQVDQQIVVAGYAAIAGNGGAWGIAVARLNPDGSLDGTFSDDGIQTMTVAGDSVWALSLAIDLNGKIVTGGTHNRTEGLTAHSSFVVARMLPDGSPDTAFSADGLATVDVSAFGDTPESDDDVGGIAVDADANVIAAGVLQTTTGKDSVVARFIGVSPPANTALPAITGTATVGSTLTCSQGTWSGPVDSQAVQWLDALGGELVGETSGTHLVTIDDAGGGVACRVTATNVGGSASATSATTSVAKVAGRVTIRQATASGALRACGSTLARACTSPGRVYLKGSCSPAAALASRQVRVRFYRRSSTGVWRHSFDRLVTASAACAWSTSTASLGAGRWRMNASMVATTHSTAALSAYQYVIRT